MITKTIAVLGIAAMMSHTAMADTASKSTAQGEALAWTVAAYASCESTEQLQSDFRNEIARMESDIVDVLAAMQILQGSDNVCGLLQTYSADMLSLAVTDMESLEAKLLISDTPVAPQFDVEEPKGAGAGIETSIILTTAGDLPPESSSPVQSSDYSQ